MKAKIKQLLLESGAYYPLLNLRSIPDVTKWINGGCRSPAPHAVKMQVVRAYLRRFNLTYFVETGTYLGETLENIARTGVHCISVELDEELFFLAERRLKGYGNVTLIRGDSGQKIPEILKTLNTPALFWLDGHYSGGMTAKGDSETPISAELSAILEHKLLNHVILIDDARHFDGTNNYPFLEELIHEVRLSSKYEVEEVSTDIIRIVPGANSLRPESF